MSVRGVGLLGAILVAAALSGSCDRGATGIEACRLIENKRCETLIGCKNVPIEDEGDVVQCRNFYHDQCLFGMADGANPDEVQVNQCLAALDQAASCKAHEFLSDCPTPPEIVPEEPNPKPCDALYQPHRFLTACGFLKPPPPPPEGGAAGAAGMGGAGGAATGGAGGTGTGGAGGAGGN